MEAPAAAGQVINIGNTEEVTITALAERVRTLAQSNSPIRYIPYDQAYDSGFEDMPRRVLSISHTEPMLGGYVSRVLTMSGNNWSRPV